MRKGQSAAVTIALVVWVIMSTAAPGLAISFIKGEYFILPAGHPDTSLILADGKIDGVKTGLVGGLDCTGGTCLPVKGGAASLLPITDVNALTQQVLWWSTAGAPGKVLEKIVLNDPQPFVSANFFPDGQLDDTQGFRAVHWSGMFVAPPSGQANFTLEADDDAFLYVRGPGIGDPLVLDDGGVKGLGGGFQSAVLTGLHPGAFYAMDLFMVDRHVAQAGILFTSDVELNTVPEPATLLLWGTTAAGIGVVRWRKGRRTRDHADAA